MLKSLSFFCFSILLLSGCGANIGSIEAYVPIPLEKSDFMPSKEEIKGAKTKVVLTPIDDKNFRLAQKANLGQSLFVELEHELSSSGTVEVLDREISKKFENEIRLSELDQDSQMSEVELSAAKYAISGSLSNAQFISRFTQALRYQDKEGKVYVIPAYYKYTASVDGILKIYSIPSMKVVKTIKFSESTSRREDSKFYGHNHRPQDTAGMINKAGKYAIHSTRHEFKNFLAPKGYVMEQRNDGDEIIVQVTIGSADGLKTGEEVSLYSVKSTINPLTDEEEIHDVKIASGTISNKITAHRAWIIIEDKIQDIKIGDYIKAYYSNGFGDFLNSFMQY